MKDIIQKINEKKIIAIVRGVELGKILPTVKALYEGGVECIEVTFNQSSETGNIDTYKAIKVISDNTDVCVGAGTVMTMEQLELAVKAGAKYIISPNFDEEIVKRTVELGAVSIPGVLTPSEVAKSYKMGASFAKLFPGGIFGSKYVKAIKAPISHIPIMVVGGVGLDNIGEFIDAGVAGFGIGSSLVNRQLIAEGKFDELTALAKKYVEAVQ